MKNRQAKAGLGWCILRTSGAKTIPLARSLALSGFDVWTPMQETLKRRRPGVFVDCEVPILPTFVFAQADQLPSLAGYLARPSSEHPPFSIFHYCGRIPVIAEAEMTSLRDSVLGVQRASLRGSQQMRPRVLPEGTKVRVEQGPYAGMSGVVDSSDGKHTSISFGGWMDRVKIETWRCLDVDVMAA